MSMEKDSKIYVAGHRGLLGSALVRLLKARGYGNINPGYYSFDLEKEDSVEEIFKREKPDYVFVCAAKVGGISDNNKYPVEYLIKNTVIALNIIRFAAEFRVKKLIFYGSNCMYPRDCHQPMNEDDLMTGPLEPTSRSYEIAKFFGLELCRSLNIQHKTNFITAIPASMYGENDHFEAGRAHALPSFIDKLHKAKISGQKEVVFWGDGSPLRELMHADDAADASIFLMENFNPSEQDNFNGDIFLNMGSGEEISMLELTRLVAEVVGYTGKINWDISRPNGMPRKLLDSSRLHSMGWRHRIGLKEGVERTYQWYLKNI